MWATYYYRGEKNSWGATEMTDVNGIYSYYSATSGAHQFKISTSASSYDYNYTYVTKNYKQTDVSDIGDYSSNNCYCWQSSAHYILVFNPNTSVNSTNKPIICAATALPSAGFESTDNTMSYYNNVDGDVKSSSLDRTNGSTIDLTSKAITSLYLKAFNTKMYQHYEVNLLGASAYHFYYKIHRTAVAAGSTGFTEVTSADSYSAGSVTWGSFDGSKYRKPTYYVTANQSLLSGLGSGLYTMSYYFTHVGTTETYRLPSTSSKYNQLKWKIPVPDISSPTCTSDGSGAGTNESPFTVAVGEDLTLTVGGSQASSDANSVLYAKFGSNAYSSTLTYKIEDLTSTKQSITVKAKYYNSADDLSGTEETWTIYYQGTLTPSLAISSFTQSESAVTAANSGSTVTINASRQNAGTSTITYAYSTDNSNWTTIASTTSTTQSWTLPDVTSTTTYYVKASMTYESTGYSDTETFTVYGKKTIKVKDTNSWGANFKIHRWGGDATGTDYPGETTNITSAGGQWKQIVLYSSSTNFLLCNGSSTSTADANKTANQTYAGVTDGYCYQIQSGTGGSLTLTSTANCPAKPTVTASAATSLTNTTATINGNISSNGNDAITDYGFYWGSTSTPGTQVSKGTSDKTGSISHNLTSLTAGATYYYQAYATNGQGTTKSTPVQSFTMPYKVTITKPTGCTSMSPGTGTKYVKVGDNISATATTGYTFSEWSTTNLTLGTPSTTDGVTTSAITAISADNGTITASYTENMTTITITANNKSAGSVTVGGAAFAWDGTTTAGVATTRALVATPAAGYYFSGWTLSDGADFAVGGTGEANASTTLRGLGDGETSGQTLTANFTELDKIYFRDVFDDGSTVTHWGDVYVYFGITWNGYSQAVTNADNNTWRVHMTKIPDTDVWWAYVPRDFTTAAAGTKEKVGFAKTNQNGKGYTFYNTKAATRGDYNRLLNMFVPFHTAKTTGNNSVDYFDDGYWMKYDTRANQGAGYYLKKYNSRNNYTQEGEFIATNDDATFIQFQERIDAGNSTLSYMITSAAGLNYVADASITSAKNTNVGVNEDTRALASNDVKFSITTTSEGYYTFILDQSGDKMKLSVIYPVEIGDYVLIHEYNDGSAKKNYSDFIKKSEASAKTVSMYLNMGAGTKSLKLYKCTAISAGHPVWGSYTTVGTGSGLFNTTTFSEGNGVYKFDVAINTSTDAVTGITNAGLYDGPYYIKTNSAPGGWADYKKNVLHQNTINFSTDDAKTFDYYMCAWIGDAGTNVKCVIANDYNNQLSDTLQGDAVIGALAQTMPAAGNVRFSYNSYTNEIKRAYISGSAYASDRFLVLEGDAKMFNESGTPLTTGNGRVSGLEQYEMNFTDDHNWIYEATVMAQPNARFKLTAKFNNQIQYFYGAAGARTDETTALLLGGSDENKYKMRIVYDFKTNRMIKAFIPSGTISTELGIEADLMIIREHQEDAQQVSFSGSGKLSDVKTVFGAMKFNKWTINNKSKAAGHAALTPSLSRYARDLFYISFPFDVNLSDAFGFGTYGTHWIIEYYDGKGRAKNGFWADSESNWKFVTPAERKNFTMNAFEGYILALDLDELGESSSVWDNDVEDVYVYFPSAAEVEDIEGTNRLIPIDQDGYECTIGPRPGMSDDRRNKDGYWHCIGVPSFANYNKDLYDTNGGTKIDWTSSSMPYLYEWNSASNTLSVTSSATFSFRATFSYLVQYAGASIYWSAVNATPASVVARQKDEPTNVEFRMELQQGEEKADQAFVRMTTDENVTTGFDFNYDLSKEFNKNKANIYTMVTTTMEDGPSVTEVAGNVLPMSEQTTIVPVGVKIATNDDYTFSIPDGTSGVGVTLIDNFTGTRTNISAVDYTVSLEAGTYNERFVLEISPIEQVITNLEPSAMEQQSDVRKLLIDGLLYIVRDGKVYDARGAKVE
jgi:hypothetical protein